MLKHLSFYSILLFLSFTVMQKGFAQQEAGVSPWGPEDEMGTLNLITEKSTFDILKRINSGKIYDLSVDIYVGMPSCCEGLGDQSFQMWMTHTQRGGLVDNPMRLGKTEIKKMAHYGEGLSMYSHTGTHIDALNHFSLNGKIWNQKTEADFLGDRGWTKSGVDKMPPIIARGVLIDVASYKKTKVLPKAYSITIDDLKGTLKTQKISLQTGDVIAIRTGMMSLWPTKEYSLSPEPGLSLAAAKWLVEEQGAILIGADNFAVDVFPSPDPNNWAPLHTYLLAQRGVPIMENLWLEELAKDKTYEFVFIATPLKFKGATASTIRPIAIRITP